MKKLFKIIPLTCLATTFTAVAPLMSSCARETKYVYDLTSGSYNQTPNQITLPKDKTSLTRVEATDLYLKMVKDDPEQFIKDYMYGRNRFIHSMLRKEEAAVKSFILSSTKPKFGTTNVTYTHMPDMTYPTVSFTVEGHLEFTLYPDPGSRTYRIDMTLDWKMKYQDVIFYAYQDVGRGEASNWTIGMTDPAEAGSESGTSMAYLYADTPWSIKADYNCDTNVSYLNPATGTITTYSQNYKFNKTLDNYYVLNDALALAYDALYDGSRDILPMGLLWYFIPMDFASHAFTTGTGGKEHSILSAVEVTFNKYRSKSWTFENTSTANTIAITFPSLIHAAGVANSLSVGINRLSYQSQDLYPSEGDPFSFKLLGNIGIQPAPAIVDQTEVWDVTFSWTLTDDDWTKAGTYFASEDVQKTVEFYYKGGTIAVSVDESPLPSFTDNFGWYVNPKVFDLGLINWE